MSRYKHRQVMMPADIEREMVLGHIKMMDRKIEELRVDRGLMLEEMQRLEKAREEAQARLRGLDETGRS